MRGFCKKQVNYLIESPWNDAEKEKSDREEALKRVLPSVGLALQ